MLPQVMDIKWTNGSIQGSFVGFYWFETYQYQQLIQASEESDYSKVVSLLERGVDPNGENVRNAPAFIEIFTDRPYFLALSDSPVIFAAKKGDIGIVKSLIDHGAIVDFCCCSCVTALHEAIINEHLAVVEFLLENGADPKLIYDGRLNPYALALRTGNSDIIKLLKSRL